MKLSPQPDVDLTTLLNTSSPPLYLHLGLGAQDNPIEISSSDESRSTSCAASQSSTIPVLVTSSPAPIGGTSDRDSTPSQSDHLPSSSRPWLSEWHVSDIAHGFHTIDTTDASARSTFSEVFGVPFVKSTYYKHRSLWDSAPVDVRNVFYNQGRSAMALWPRFVEACQDQGVGRHIGTSLGKRSRNTVD